MTTKVFLLFLARSIVIILYVVWVALTNNGIKRERERDTGGQWTHKIIEDNRKTDRQKNYQLGIEID